MNPFRTLRPLVLAIASWSFALGVFAQPASPPPAEPVVTVQFILYGWNTTLPSLRYSQRDVVPELTEPFDISAVQNYTGPATLKFYAATTNLDPRLPPPPPAATITLPEGPTRFVLVTARVARGQYRIYAVPADGPAITPSSIRIHNFTDTPLAVQYDETGLLEIPPASAASIRPQGAATVLRVAQFREGRWRRVFNNVAELGPEGRLNIILAPDAQRPASMFTIPPWPKDAPVAAN